MTKAFMLVLYADVGQPASTEVCVHQCGRSGMPLHETEDQEYLAHGMANCGPGLLCRRQLDALLEAGVCTDKG